MEMYEVVVEAVAAVPVAELKDVMAARYAFVTLQPSNHWWGVMSLRQAVLCPSVSRDNVLHLFMLHWLCYIYIM